MMVRVAQRVSVGRGTVSIVTNRRAPAAPIVSRRSRKIIAALTAGLALAGCSVPHLQGETVNVGSSVGSIYTSQVLENLYDIAQDSNAIPSEFAISQGSIQTSNTITPGVSIPLGNTVTRTVASGGITQVVAPYNGLSLQGSEGWTQSWQISPQEDAQVLRSLHFIYGYVVANACKAGDSVVTCESNLMVPFGNVFPQLDAAATNAAVKTSSSSDVLAAIQQAAVTAAQQQAYTATEQQRQSAATEAKAAAVKLGESTSEQQTAETTASGQVTPTLAAPVIPTQNDTTLMARIIVNCKGGCFEVRNGQPCTEPPPAPSDSAGWICLDRYNSAYEIPVPHEMMISKAAYQNNVLFDLVALSLQLQSEAAANASKSTPPANKPS